MPWASFEREPLYTGWFVRPIYLRREPGMNKANAKSVVYHFGSLADPRIDRTKRHWLIDIVVISICAVVCGAEDWVAIAEYGQAQQAWFSQFLELPHGIPS